MAVKYEIRAKTGTYTDKEGNEKSSYMTVGKILETKNGDFMLKLDSVPMQWDGWAYLNTPQPKDEAPKSSKAGGTSRQTRQSEDLDEIPF